MGPYLPRVALALRTPAWDFHIVRGGIGPGDHRFRPWLNLNVRRLWLVGVAHV